MYMLPERIIYDFVEFGFIVDVSAWRKKKKFKPTIIHIHTTHSFNARAASSL
jgi:hypothetical protein